MSVDLEVPITREIAFAELFPMSQKIMSRMLGGTNIPNLEGNELCRGEKLLLPQTLYPGFMGVVRCPFPEMPADIEFGSMQQLFDLAERYPNAIALATIAVRRSGGDPQNLVLGASLAAAIASICATEIVDDCTIWTKQTYTIASDFIDRLAIASPKNSFRESVAEFVSRMTAAPHMI